MRRTPFFPLVFSALLAGSPAVSGQVATTEFSEYEEAVGPAVERALRFLDTAQREDGTFDGAHGKSTGIVSLVGMTYLSKGYTPVGGPFAPRINRCIDYLLEHADDDGVLDSGDGGNGPMYAHTISTLFLSEVSGMLDPDRQARVRKALAKANNAIIRAQAVKKDDRHQGGWRYRMDSTDSDLSCSGWALMALKSSRLNGAPVPDQVISDAVGYIFKNYGEKGGTFGYQDDRGHAETLTGAGLLCLELSGYHGHESTLKAGDFIMEKLGKLEGDQHEYYGNYYNAQGTFQLGGRYWERYAGWMYPTYLAKQKDNGAWDGRLGEVYSTSMIVLAFTVPYRQLPIYQRDETVGEVEE